MRVPGSGRLSHNESSLPPSEALIESLTAQLARLHRYPEPQSTELRDQLGEHYGVAREQVSVGNGASELLYALAHTSLAPGSNVVYPWPSYYAYPKLATMTRSESRPVALDATDTPDFERLTSSVDDRTGLVAICNPNNPTGTGVDLPTIRNALEAIPGHTSVLLDEAYCEFSSHGLVHGSVALLAEFPNVMLLRTFSKAYRLAGIRVGYLLAAERAVRRAVERSRPGFSVNRLASAAAALALEDQMGLERHVRHVLTERERLRAGLIAAGLRPAVPDGNFVWARLPESLDDTWLAEMMAQESVVIATGSDLCGIKGLRITAGTGDETDRCLQALEASLCAAGTERW